MKNNNLQKSYLFCERIAQKNSPYLYQVSRYFYDENKYWAFCSTYASMRIIDDKVDNIEYRAFLTKKEKLKYYRNIDRWLMKIYSCRNSSNHQNLILISLQDTFQKFSLPFTLWENLALAMKEDIGKDCFESFAEFLEYAQGAAVAPATAFMFLLTAQKNENRYSWSLKNQEIHNYAYDLALFCYLTHILRDISLDLELGKTGLVYLPKDELERFSLTKEDLLTFKQTQKINLNFKKLMRFQIERASKYEEEGEKLIKQLSRELSEDAFFILRLLVSYYSETIRKIKKIGFNVFKGDEILSSKEENVLTGQIVKNTNYDFSKAYKLNSVKL